MSLSNNDVDVKGTEGNNRSNDKEIMALHVTQMPVTF